MTQSNKNYFRSIVFTKYTLVVLCVAIIVSVLPKGRTFKFEFDKGKSWMHQNLNAPFDFAIEKSKEEIALEKNKINKNALPYFQLDQSLSQEIKTQFEREFYILWKQKYLNENKLLKNKYLAIVNEKLTAVLAIGIMANENARIKKSNAEEFYLLKGNQAILSEPSSHYTIASAYQILHQQLSAIKPADTAIVFATLQNTLSENIIYDEVLSIKINNDAINNISTYEGMVAQGDLIIENGTMVDEAKFRELESLKNEYDRRLGVLGNKYLVVLGQTLLVSLIITLLMVFLSMFRKDIYADLRKMFLILSIVTGMLLVLSWALRLNLPTLYFIPYCIVPIIIRVIFDTRLALYIHLLVVVLAGFFVPNGYEFIFLQLTAGMVAINSIKNLLRRSQFLISAILIYATYVIGYIGISIIHEGSFIPINWDHLLWFLVSVILSLVAYPVIYAFEKLFGITTEVTLMEYTNINNKLLRELSYKAPGTFQHSLQVANLAEAAIFKIGGNALLVRAGALYHDIGKMETPEFFIENQQRGINPHDHLAYEESAKIIIRHVYAGIEIATKNRLPSEIIDFIRTHHGNTRVDYFYQSFLKNYPEKSINENVFRYPGPIPFAKEQAVLMLADSVEAASRSLKEPSEQTISELVERIIEYKINQHQFINSDISFKEIYIIKQLFKEMLMSMYHIRMGYQIENS